MTQLGADPAPRSMSFCPSLRRGGGGRRELDLRTGAGASHLVRRLVTKEGTGARAGERGERADGGEADRAPARPTPRFGRSGRPGAPSAARNLLLQGLARLRVSSLYLSHLGDGAFARSEELAQMDPGQMLAEV